MRINQSHIAVGLAGTALFVAAGGPAQAGSLITGSGIKNSSVTGKDIKNSSLTAADIKNNSLSGSDIKNISGGDIKDRSLRAQDFAPGQVPTGPAGPAGPAGAAGAKGDKGDKGDPGPSRWVTVNAAGAIEAQSGGFRIANAYPAANGPAGNVYIESGDSDLTNNGIVATIQLQNQTDQNGDGISSGAVDSADSNPEFSGEITATPCAITGVVACAPMDIGVTPNVPANAKNYFVVSPRSSDGSRTTSANRKRFTVVISGPRD